MSGKNLKDFAEIALGGDAKYLKGEIIEISVNVLHETSYLKMGEKFLYDRVRGVYWVEETLKEIFFSEEAEPSDEKFNGVVKKLQKMNEIIELVILYNNLGINGNYIKI